LIGSRTDGQPLFTVSLLEFLASGGDFVNINGWWRLVGPPGGDDSGDSGQRARDDPQESQALDASSRLTLQYARVEGEELLSTVVAILLDRDELEAEEELAVLATTHRLFEIREEEELPDGALATHYAFAHTLYQNVLYEELVSQRRALLHNLTRPRLPVSVSIGDRAAEVLRKKSLA